MGGRSYLLMSYMAFKNKPSLPLVSRQNTIHWVMPLSIIIVQPLKITNPCLKLMVLITNKKHATTKRLKVRVWGQLGLKFIINWGPMKALATSILSLHRSHLTMFIIDGNIEQRCSRPIFVSNLNFQLLDVMYKNWTN